MTDEALQKVLAKGVKLVLVLQMANLHGLALILQFDSLGMQEGSRRIPAYTQPKNP